MFMYLRVDHWLPAMWRRRAAARFRQLCPSGNAPTTRVRQWGERFPVRATAFAAETPPAREVLADSRTMKGGGAAGVATLGAAGVEVAQSVLAETQTAIPPLVPYLDTLRWVFIAVALAGIAVTIYDRLDDWKKGLR
jgi:hypothetical protein